jgi:hypothetical protein
MKRILTVGAFVTVLTFGVVLAQDTTPLWTAPGTPPAQEPAGANQPAGENTPRIAPGSIIPVELTKTIDARKAKTGDEIVAKVTMDMKSNTGAVIVPKDTKVMGHVTEAQARSKEQKESQLAISFDQAVLKNQQVPLPMSIQAVIGPQTSNDNSASAPSAMPSSSPSPSSTGSAGTSPMAGRSPMGGSVQQPTPTADSPQTPGSPQSTNQRPQITASTQGVIGISNVTLAPAPSGTQGSVLSSEKNNVKLESGTMLLLKVSQ